MPGLSSATCREHPWEALGKLVFGLRGKGKRREWNYVRSRDTVEAWPGLISKRRLRLSSSRERRGGWILWRFLKRHSINVPYFGGRERGTSSFCILFKVRRSPEPARR